MSTRAYIGIEDTDGTVAYVYNHRDGYPSECGVTLDENWTDPDKIRELIGNGGMSSVGCDLEDTDFYCRDWGREVEINTGTRDAIQASCWHSDPSIQPEPILMIEHVYVYSLASQRWDHSDLYSEWQPLKDVIAAIQSGQREE